MAAPLIVININQTGMQFVDAWMMSKLGPEALAAVMPAGFSFMVVLSFGWGLFSTLGAFVSQCLGREDYQGCGFHGQNALLPAFIYGLIVLLPGWYLSPWFFGLMGHEPQVLAWEIDYFRFCLIGTLPHMVGAVFYNFMTGVHRTNVLLVSSIVSCLCNVVFNYVLIFGWGPFPAMDMKGAALGTTLAVTVSTIILAGVYWSKEMRETYSTWQWKFSKAVQWKLLRVGTPAGLQIIVDIGMWGIVMPWYIGLSGTAALAANTIIVRYMSLSFMPAFGLAWALAAFVGKSIGQGDPDKAHRQTMMAFRWISLYMVCMGLIFILGRNHLLGWFSDDSEVIAIGRLFFLLAAGFQFFDSMFITFSNALRGAGETRSPAITLSTLAVVVLGGGGFLMVKLFPDWGPFGPWAAGATYAILLGLSMLTLWMRGGWRKIRLFEN